jgi:hypothetical protein
VKFNQLSARGGHESLSLHFQYLECNLRGLLLSFIFKNCKSSTFITKSTHRCHWVELTTISSCLEALVIGLWQVESNILCWFPCLDIQEWWRRIKYFRCWKYLINALCWVNNIPLLLRCAWNIVVPRADVFICFFNSCKFFWKLLRIFCKCNLKALVASNS